MKLNNKEIKLNFIKGFFSGLGWMFGATVGFALLLTFLSLLLGWAGGLPIVGNLIANIIEVTNRALEAKKLIPR
jgi:hypothetical protein